jgi:hypothetical protein
MRGVKARRRFGYAAMIGSLLIGLAPAAAYAEACEQPSDPIDTDRPDTTNSALVIPAGSLQEENGVNVSRSGGADVLDGTNSRFRFGVSPCFEVLVDLPNYVGVFSGRQSSGFGDVAPAVKWQVSPAPGKFDLSVVIGAALPTGDKRIAGPGVQPYLQAPWSFDLGDGWTLNGMQTLFFTPSDPTVRVSNQSTVTIEKDTTERSFLFVEYVGNFPDHGASNQLINSGGGYRITNNQQIDFHAGWGLDRNAPEYVFGVGYSFRLDRFL